MTNSISLFVDREFRISFFLLMLRKNTLAATDGGTNPDELDIRKSWTPSFSVKTESGCDEKRLAIV